MIRFPMVCTRCGKRDHYVEDCKVPTNDQLSAATHERAAFRQMIIVLVLAQIVISYFEWAPA